MSDSTLTITLYERDVRFILEALESLEAKWLAVSRTDEDEDVQGEYGMDAAVLDLTREKLQKAAVEIFGERIREFLHEAPLPPFAEDAPKG